MDIAYLSEFVALSSELNFSKASKLCNISQPALSNHILALEQELGVQLFERTKRRVELTQEGRILLNDAQKLLDTFESMHRLSKKNLIDNHIITVGGFLENPEILGLLATRIRNFASAAGHNAKLLCDYAPFLELGGKLLQGKLDFIVAYRNSFDEELRAQLASVSFHDDPFFVVINKEHPLAERSSVKMEDLRDFHFIKLAASTFDSGWEQVELACQRNGFTPRYHSVFVDSLYDCPFIDIDANKCFVIAYGGFSNGLAFNARQDVALIPVENEAFEIDLFFRRADVHPLIDEFVRYLEGLRDQPKRA